MLARAGRARAAHRRTRPSSPRALPVAEDITVEADSGGHTDNRPLVALLPAILALRDELVGASRLPAADPGRRGRRARHARRRSRRRSRSAPPTSLTGSVNQAAVESGLSRRAARRCSPRPDLADVMMAPAADMFELGVKVQVLQARHDVRAARRASSTSSTAATPSLEATPAASCGASSSRRSSRASLDEVWSETRALLAAARPGARSSAPSATRSTGWRWCSAGTSGSPAAGRSTATPARRIDYQIWCGPAMGAFNDWVAGIVPRADPSEPRASSRSRCNLLEGAAVVTRAQQLRSLRRRRCPPSAFAVPPAAAAPDDASDIRSSGRHESVARRRPRSPSSASARSSPARIDAAGFWRDILAGTRPRSPTCPPTHWLIEDYYDPDPDGARQDLRPARRVPRRRSTSTRWSSASRRASCRRPTPRSCSR